MSNLKLSISIMAHPSRKKFFPYLFEKLENCPLAIDEGWGLWENAKRAWKLYDPEADYHVVIQDDALVCKNFGKRALEVLGHSEKVFRSRPHICNFYYDQMLAPKATNKDSDGTEYIIRSRVHWAVAICFPVNQIEKMIKYCDELKIKGDDERITQFLKSEHLKVYFPIPCLVDHRTDVPSLAGTKSPTERKAWRYIE